MIFSWRVRASSAWTSLRLDSSSYCGLLDAIVLLRLGDLGLGLVLGRLALLPRLGRLDGRVAGGVGLGDGRVTLGLGLTLDGVALDLGGAGAAQRLQVLLVVADVLDDKGHDLQAHVGQVAARDLQHLLGKGVPVLVDLFDGQHAQDGAQVTGQRLVGDVDDAVRPLGQELLGGGIDGGVLAPDLDLGHAVDVDRHALDGVDAADLDLDGQDLHREDVDPLQDGDDEGAAALDHAEADPLLSARSPG